MVKLHHKQGLVSLRSKRPTPNPCRVLAQVLKRPMRHKRIFPKGRLRLRQYSVRVCRWMTCSSPSVFHELENRRGRVSPSVHTAPVCDTFHVYGTRRHFETQCEYGTFCDRAVCEKSSAHYGNRTSRYYAKALAQTQGLMS